MCGHGPGGRYRPQAGAGHLGACCASVLRVGCPSRLYPGVSRPGLWVPVAIKLIWDMTVLWPLSNADFHATRSAQWWSGEFEVEATACPPGDGGIGWEVGLAEDG